MNQSTSEPASAGTGASESYERTTDSIASAAHDLVDRLARSASHAEREIRDGSQRAKQRARDVEREARHRKDEWVGEAERFVERHPVASAGIAFAAGVVLSSMLRR